MDKTRKAIFVAAGLACFAAGTVGIFLPILPTVPLYLLAGICFANGSERIAAWFEGTSLYRDTVAPIKAGEGMTMHAKLTSFATMCVLLGFGFYMMRHTPARWILVGVIVFHAWLFFLHLPTRES